MCVCVDVRGGCDFHMHILYTQTYTPEDAVGGEGVEGVCEHDEGTDEGDGLGLEGFLGVGNAVCVCVCVCAYVCMSRWVDG